MKSIQIKSDIDVVYTIDPVEETAKRESAGGKTQWSLNYELKDRDNKVVGNGSIKMACPEDHQHLEDAKIFSTLVRAGAVKIKNDIETERRLESREYEIKISSCLFSA